MNTYKFIIVLFCFIISTGIISFLVNSIQAKKTTTLIQTIIDPNIRVYIFTGYLEKVYDTSEVKIYHNHIEFLDNLNKKYIFVKDNYKIVINITEDE
jgi:hypothetical protein